MNYLIVLCVSMLGFMLIPVISPIKVISGIILFGALLFWGMTGLYMSLAVMFGGLAFGYLLKEA